MEKKVDIVVLGARFAKIRKKWGWSQAQVAKESGLSPNVVSMIEKGKKVFSDEFFKMQQFYLKSISPVLYFTEDFDVNCDWNSAEMCGQAISKAKVQIMRDDFKKEREEKSKEYVDRMNNIIECLSLTS